MTEMKTVKCDRCGEIFHIPEFNEDEDNFALSVTFYDKELVTDDYDLCADCYCTMLCAIGEFREAVDKAVEEELNKKYPKCPE